MSLIRRAQLDLPRSVRPIPLERRESSGARWRALSYALLFTVFVVMLLSFSDYGITWDERLQRQYGDYLLQWYSSFFQNHSALHYVNLFYYGGFFEIIAQLTTKLSPLGVHETRHLVNAGFGLLAIVGAYKLGSHLAGAMGGFFSALFLTLTPVFYGHSFGNPKDIPFAALLIWALYYLVRSYDFLPRLPKNIVLKLGITMGLALGVRIGGLLLVGYMLLLWSVWFLTSLNSSEFSDRRNTVKQLARSFFSTLLLAWGVMLIWWPWAQVSPLINPLKALRAASKFSWPGTVLFEGQYFPASDLPRTYLPVWFSISLPEFYFVAALCGIGVAAKLALNFRKSHARFEWLPKIGLLMFVVCFPILTAILLHSTLYDGLRHFLFVVPPLAILAGVSLASFLRSSFHPLCKVGAGTLVGLSVLVTLVDMVQLHPYQTVYFNRLVGGGLANASQRFETDYWGSSYKEGAQWVIENYSAPKNQKIRVANPSDPFLTSYYFGKTEELRQRFATVQPDNRPHLFLATTRFGSHRAKIRKTKQGSELLLTSLDKNRRSLWLPTSEKGASSKVLHIVQRQGVPLLYIIEVERPR